MMVPVRCAPVASLIIAQNEDHLTFLRGPMPRLHGSPAGLPAAPDGPVAILPCPVRWPPDCYVADPVLEADGPIRPGPPVGRHLCHVPKMTPPASITGLCAGCPNAGRGLFCCATVRRKRPRIYVVQPAFRFRRDAYICNPRKDGSGRQAWPARADRGHTAGSR